MLPWTPDIWLQQLLSAVHPESSCNAHRESMEQNRHHLLPALSPSSSGCHPCTLHLLQDTPVDTLSICKAVQV